MVITIVENKKESSLSKTEQEEKKLLINQILSKIKSVCILENRNFDYGDHFLTLLFKTNDELRKIKKLIKA